MARTGLGADDRDGAHGRIDGPLAWELGVGASFGPGQPRPDVEARLRYLASIGVFAVYEGGSLGSAEQNPRRLVALGGEVRPLFLGRWLSGYEWGSPTLDLAVDSLGFELGAVFAQTPGVGTLERPGLQLGIGFEVPLMGKASGLFAGVHTGLRWSEAALGSSSSTGPGDRVVYVALSLAWQQVMGATASGIVR